MLCNETVESSQAKKLYVVYEEMTQRVKVVLEVELPTIERELDRLLLQRHQRSTRHLSGTTLWKGPGDVDSHVDTCQVVSESLEAAEAPVASGSLLARPLEVWKYERNKNEYEGTSIPCDLVCLERHGRVVVAEYDNVNSKNNRLYTLDATTGEVKDCLVEGHIHPLGMALSRDQQHLVVSDCKSKRVKIVSLTTGSVVMEMGKGQFGWPYGVSVSGRGVVVVSDAFNDCILLFSPDGKKLKSFGSTGSQMTQFRNPYHLACDATERIYVSDSGNNCVKVFDVNGNFHFAANEASRRYSDNAGESMTERKRSRLRGPRGVAVDERRNLFVADDHNRISMFDCRGNYKRCGLLLFRAKN